MFERLGAKVFDADAAARKAVKKGTPIYKAIRKIFGPGFFRPNGELDRKKMAAHVFSHPKDLHKLNVLVHPGVIFECLKTIERLKGRKGVLVLDVPLLYESRMESLAEAVVVVTASEPQRLERAGRKGISRALARKILSTQWPLGKKARLADIVIENDGSLAELRQKVKEAYETVVKKNSRD